MMLSSSGERADQLRCAELGIAAYLTKPVYAGDLLAAIERATGPQSESPAPREASVEGGRALRRRWQPARPHPAR